jgi:hypothetical protein
MPFCVRSHKRKLRRNSAICQMNCPDGLQASARRVHAANRQCNALA